MTASFSATAVATNRFMLMPPSRASFSTAAGSIEINDVTYVGANPTAKVTGKLGDGVTPYLGLGYTTNPVAAKGLRFNAGLGVVFQNPKVKVSVSGVNDPSGTLEADRAEAERKLEKDLDDLRTYPVVTIGVSYSF
jgi:hypothetical protein